MHRYNGSWKARLPLILSGLMFGTFLVGWLWLFVVLPSKERGVLSYAVFGGMTLVHAGVTWYMAYSLIESFTRYKVDDDGITRRGWNGTRRMRWAHVTHYKASGRRDATIGLTDHRGNALLVCLSLLGEAPAAELRGLLETYLADVRRQQQTQLGQGKVYRSKRALVRAGCLLLVMSLFVAIGLAKMFGEWEPRSIGEWAAMGFLIAFCAGMVLFGVWMLVLGYTYRLTITEQGISAQSAFGRRDIVFAEVTSFHTREMPGRQNGSPVQYALLQQGVSKIFLSAQLTDYPLLVAFIRARVPDAALTDGTQQVVSLDRRDARQRLWILGIYSPILVVVFIGMGWSGLQDGRDRLARQDTLDRRGQTVQGRVTDKYASNGKSPTEVYFTFQIAGQVHRGGSPILKDDFEQMKIGDTLPVRYLADDPTVCRANISIGREQAQKRIQESYLVLGMGFVLPPLLIVSAVWEEARKKRKNAAKYAENSTLTT